MAKVSFSKQFIGTLKSFLPLNCGIPESMRNNISGRYIVTITTSAGVEIWGYLQDKLELSVSSDWTSVSDILGGLDKTVDSAVQIGSKVLTKFGVMSGTVSTASQMGSRRKWSGSSPIKFNLTLRFEAFEDVKNDVINPCIALKQLVVPRRNPATGSFFLIPPGPDPWYIPGLEEKGGTAGIGEDTTLNIGGFLKLDSVIVENVTITLDNRMSEDGPVGATAKVTMSSYELLTKEDIQKMYTNMGKMVDSLDSLKGTSTLASVSMPNTAKVQDTSTTLLNSSPTQSLMSLSG